MPTKVTVDCSTGEHRTDTLTAEEEAERDAIVQASADREAAEQQAAADAAAAQQAWRDAVSAATSVAALRDAILGTNLPAQAETRVKP